jgi:hypothetical protein
MHGQLIRLPEKGGAGEYRHAHDAVPRYGAPLAQPDHCDYWDFRPMLLPCFVLIRVPGSPGGSGCGLSEVELPRWRQR